MAVLSDATISRLRLLPQRLAWPDPYEVLRTVSGGTDSVGNTLPATDAVVETGVCHLTASGLGPEERVAELARLGWSVPYVVDLRFDTILTPSDRLRIGNRIFEVKGVSKENRWGISAKAVVQEIG